MKMKLAHIVPLPKQSLHVLNELRPLTGYSLYVFTCHRTPLRCMSDNAINVALRRMGFEKSEVTAHGFRAAARTMLHEVLQFSPDAIEAQLAHAVPDRLGRAYNRTQHLAERKKKMQIWADYLDGLKVGAKVIPLKRTA
jgi:integrase